MSEEGSDTGDLVCHWALCSEEFDSSRALDLHVESAHIKVKKASAVGGAPIAKKEEKGLVCEWKDCESDKIFRDSWNLVTHMRYKHTHFKPFSCVHVGCSKSFVQLHQMKKHSKTPHGQQGSGASSAPGVRKRVAPKVDSDGEYEELVLAEVAEAAKKQRAQRASAVSAGASHAMAEEEPSRPQSRNGRPMGADEAEAAGVLARVEQEAEERPFDTDRNCMVISPTSLLLSNTTWQAAGRSSLWSPPGFGMEFSGVDDLSPRSMSSGSMFIPISLAGDRINPSPDFVRIIPSRPVPTVIPAVSQPM